jgi:hypothetical protein
MSEDEELKKSIENTVRLFADMDELTSMLNKDGGTLTRETLLKKINQMKAEVKCHPESDPKEIMDMYIQELMNIANTNQDE